MNRNSIRSHLLRAAAALCMTALVPAISHALPQGQRSAVGMNLSGWDYWVPDIPLIDQFKRGSGWLTQCYYPTDVNCKNFTGGAGSWDTLEESKLDLDEHGWVKSLPNTNDNSVKYRYVSTVLFAGNGKSQPAGKYTVLYEGKGTIEYGMIGSKVANESAPGRDIVQVADVDGGLLISIKATDPADYIRNVRVLPPGGVCQNAQNDYAASASDCAARGTGAFVPFEKFAIDRWWHPYFVSELKGFRTLRFMDWGKTNSNHMVNWTERPRRHDAFWAGVNGVPFEAMFDLADVTGSDPWINLGTYVNDDYAKNFGRRAKARLGVGRTLYLEYANEPWNYAFTNSHWMKDQAAAKWPDQIAKGQSAYTLQNSWYGLRSAQLCQIVKAEFGADANRVKCVANGQAANAWISNEQLSCPFAAAELGKPCGQVLNALSIAPYFAAYIGDLAVRSTVSTWYKDADGGLSKMFEEILAVDANGNKVTPPLYGKTIESKLGGAVEATKTWVVDNKAVADKFALPMLSYEGGQHLTMWGGDTDQKWQDLFIAANRDPRMGKAYTKMMENWQAAGGQTFTFYSHIARPTGWGAWGAKETQYTTQGVKWQAMLPYRDTRSCWWTGCNN
jgi:hypothetical protein